MDLSLSSGEKKRGRNTFSVGSGRPSYSQLVRFQVLTAASMKMTVCWDIAPCNLVGVYRPDDGGSKHL
jgi:hypothetical protein